MRELPLEGISAVGFGIPSRVDQKTGVVLGAVNIPIHEVDFRSELERRLELPVGIENDANAAAYAEFKLGAGRDVSDLVLLTLGTGVGGGIVIGGSLFHGWAELGHVVIVEDGEPCRGACSGRGHVEAYCSGRAADALARRVLGADATAHDLVAQRHSALNAVGHHLGVAIGSLVNIFHPQMVVIGGGFGRRGVRAAPAVCAARRADRGARTRRAAAGDRAGDPRGASRPDRCRARRVRGRLMPLAVCATPIGNLEDVTLRVLSELREADVVLAEDTRHTRGLLERHGIAARLLSLHEHNEAARVAELLPRLAAGERMALVSDAGMPVVSDPGARLVRAALDAGVEVTVLPGPVSGRDRARREWSRRRALRVRRLPAAQGGRAGRALARARRLARAGRRVRVAAAARRFAPLARGLRRRARGRGLPRADEALRGGRPRLRVRARGAFRDGTEGRDHRRARARRSGRPTPPRLATRSRSSSPQAHRGVSPPTSSRA